MSDTPLILSIDQGTTSSRAMLFEKDGSAFFTAQREFTQFYPQSGWVEHDPEEIWDTTLAVCKEALAAAAERPILAIGITTQRETTLLWDRKTGKAVYNAIVWQDRRTASFCKDLKDAGHESSVTAKTGLLLDPYFSGTKIRWILDNADARAAAERGELAFGTMDSWLLWRLTNGKVHATDATNASRTLLFNIHTGEWDSELLSLLDVPASLLPDVRDSAADFGTTDSDVLGAEIPVLGIAGDQHAASIGQVCFREGMVKSTYGTGCFVMLNTGDKPLASKNKMLTTIAYRLNGKTTYALEGSIFVAGAAVQWLRDGLKVINSAEETEEIARNQDTNNGVYLVPAFTGMGAPYWDPDARGAIFGLTRDTGPEDLVRATLESVCYQTVDLLKAFADDGATLDSVRVDGGMVNNNWMVQFLADTLNLEVHRPKQTETTALGAAYLAGLQCGLYASLDDLTDNWQQDAAFSPLMDKNLREDLLGGWADAVQRTRSHY
ncbi:MAG: glycerol kinase GlpK [Granulosicoccus sp.]|nr:glycerol kinase GlpK [Granulosicoccus sp.]